MEKLVLKPIGKVCVDDSGFHIELEQEYIKGLTNLDNFAYINVLWWFSNNDDPDSRSTLIAKSPYKGSPPELGIFATRSECRPNPIALTCSYITGIDHDKGIIRLAYIDALDGTPVLDIKPYTPSFDSVENPIVPDWCKDWPNSLEKSGDFNWSSVFNF